MCINQKYNIKTGKYARNHFLKSFSKKYKTWDNTFSYINDMLSRIDRLLLTSNAERIHIWNNLYIAKCEFKIAWSNQSAKSSWNRIIVYVDQEQKEITILLIHSKTDIKWNNETVWRQQEIKNNYNVIKKSFPNI